MFDTLAKRTTILHACASILNWLVRPRMHVPSKGGVWKATDSIHPPRPSFLFAGSTKHKDDGFKMCNMFHHLMVRTHIKTQLDRPRKWCVTLGVPVKLSSILHALHQHHFTKTKMFANMCDNRMPNLILTASKSDRHFCCSMDVGIARISIWIHLHQCGIRQCDRVVKVMD